MAMAFTFPKGFLWGVATASCQVEGGAEERGVSIWDTYCRTPWKVKHGVTADVACDSYHRFRDDIKLMQELGIKAYRFSIAWPRVVPDGDGAVNEKGLDFYRRLVDALLAAGIQPWATCYHWDMPEATYRKHGGWHGRQSAYDFARYAGIVAKSLGDRVQHWFAINEFVCFTHIGYGLGAHAPGEKVDRKRLNQLSHHAILAHGLAVDAIRANAPRPALVGLAENYHCCVPLMETPEHVAAARQAFRAGNGGFLVPVVTGAYDPLWLEQQGADAPKVEAGDMKQIARPLDFVALNVYTGSYTRAGGKGGFENIEFPPEYPLYNIQWLRHLPDALYWGLRIAQEELGLKTLYISENGCCCGDVLTDKGEVLDIDRVQYLRDYLRQASRAIADGVNLKGYFLWTLMDNFEWAEGYTKRFGLYYTDFATQQRIPKLSAKWYAQVTRANRVL